MGRESTPYAQASRSVQDAHQSILRDCEAIAREVLDNWRRDHPGVIPTLEGLSYQLCLDGDTHGACVRTTLDLCRGMMVGWRLAEAIRKEGT